MSNIAAPLVIGVSLKMYFDAETTELWCGEVAALARRHPAITGGTVSLFVMPSFTALSTAIDHLNDTSVSVGAQDLFWEDRGPFTGEVSGADLEALGCTFAEIGHAERRNVLGESAEMTSLKLAAAVRNSLTPVVCIGESEFSSPAEAVEKCVAQLSDLLADTFGDAGEAEAGASAAMAPIIVAYEPEWAIGSEQAASVEHISTVCASLRELLKATPGFGDSRVIYGGSAGPGLLTRLGDSVDGLFLGRFAHDVSSLERVLDEAIARS